jgi:Zn-dependent protease with chaperone function
MLVTVSLLSAAVTRLGAWVALRPRRHYQGEAWTEQARLAWPGRRVARAGPLLVLFPVLIAVSRGPGSVDLIHPLATTLLVVAAVLAGGIAAGRRLASRLNPAVALTHRPGRAAWILGFSVAIPLALIQVLAALTLPAQLDIPTATILTIEALAVGAYFNWVWAGLLRGTGVIRPASERLRTIVERVSEGFDVRPRAIEQASLPMANAMVFAASGRLAVTDAALAILDDDELAAVMAHELAHLGEPRRLRAARMSMGFLLGVALALLLAAVGPVLGSYGANAMWLTILGAGVILLVGLIQFARLSRRMEAHADAAARRWETAPGTYARALERLYMANSVPAVLRARRQTHPELYDRLVEAGVSPEYPRPAPPPRGPFHLGVLVALAASIAGA